MPLMMISPATMQLVRAGRPAGFTLAGSLLRVEDGSWLVSVSDAIAVQVATERVRGESDDGVVSRLLREAGSARPPTAYSSVTARHSL
jgi:hypothetical protein